MIKSVSVLLLFLLGLKFSCVASQPNILIIMTDDVDVESFDVYSANPKNTHDSNALIETPNISTLASEGVLFENAFTTPLCTPTRAFLMTGKYNYRNYRAFGYLDNKPTTFAQVLRENGYTTAVAGKWQLSEPDSAAPSISPSGATSPNITPAIMQSDYGFDDYMLWQLNFTQSSKGSRYWNPKLETPSADRLSSVLVSTDNSDYGPDIFVNFLKDFISDAVADGTPFCAYYPMVLPHDPWVSTPAAVGSKNGDRERYWDDNIEYIDYLVGQLVAHLDDPDNDSNTADSVRDNTLVIFMSDNGTHPRITVINDERGSVTGDKGEATFDGTHIPFIMSWRNKLSVGTSERMVDASDVFATLLSVAGIDEPEDLNLDGLPILDAAGTLQNNRDIAYIWYDSLGRGAFFDPNEFAQNKDYKLYSDGSFFKVSTDPLETTDLSAGSLNSTEQAARDALQAVLDFHAPRILDRSQAPTLDANVWDIAPRPGLELGSTEMRAASSLDLNDPIEWQFENVTLSTISDWQNGRDFQETGVGISGDIEYRVRARDLFENTSAWSQTSLVEVVADPNPTETAEEHVSADGESGGANLGQSFTVSASYDGAILHSINLWGSSRSDGGNSWYMGIYDGFTDLNTRGNLLAVSVNEVTNPRQSGELMTWEFGNLLLEGGQQYFMAVCDSNGLPLASGEGVPCERSSTNTYSGGTRLKETGTDSLDLRFRVLAHQFPRSFDQWGLSLPDGADTSFSGKQSAIGPSNGARYFFGEHYENPLSINAYTISFPFAPGPLDIDWRIRKTSDLMLPLENWDILVAEDPEVVVDWANRMIHTTGAGDKVFFKVEIKLNTEDW